MNNRIYNISFDLHTVSGIVISVLLYVIFFAGAFSFFRDDIINWERNKPTSVHTQLNINVDAALDSISKKYPLYGREILIRRSSDERNVTVYISDSENKADTLKGEFYYMDTETYHLRDYESSYSLGEFLYRLHFFAQIPYPVGYYLSGFTALFFLFAIVTGIIVHWEKIITNFYLFRPWAKLKAMWTDAHTVLGTIGLPFQFVYAVTGAYFMIRIFLLIPTVLFLYNGDAEKIYHELGVELPHYEFAGKALNEPVSINPMIETTASRWKNFTVTQVEIFNYGDSNMHVAVAGELDKSVSFTGNGQFIFHAADHTIINTKDPYTSTTYVEGVLNSLTRLHYADYGGYALKIVSFILALITCFVIISGILIWLEARNKKSIPEKKKKFNETVGHIYMAMCLSMYPVTALAFIVTKLLPSTMDGQRQTILYEVYFGVWLLLTILFTIRKNNQFTNRISLLLGAILGLMIPVVNGIISDNWFWNSFIDSKHDLLMIDLLWIGLSALAICALYRINRSKPSTVSVNQAKSKAILETAEA